MQRRSFFKSLAVMAGAASASPLIFIPKFEPVKWKVDRGVKGLGYNMYPIPQPLTAQEFWGKWEFMVLASGETIYRPCKQNSLVDESLAFYFG